MEEQRLKYLLQQQLAGTATPQERDELANAMRSDTHSEMVKTLMAGMMQEETPAFPADRAPWQQMEKDILAIDRPGIGPLKNAPTRILRMVRWSAAAAVLLLLGLGVYMLTDHLHTASLAGAGRAVPDSVIATARGEQRELTLPDGSHVWLNAASSIRFPPAFAGRERVVELSGEAFFEIEHADRMPFVIHTGAVTTTVLGTAFDCRAYPGQKNIRVAVENGKVKVQAANKQADILEKGRQILINADDNTAAEKNIDPHSVAAWRTGDLVYKDERLEDIAADLARVFSDSIEIKTPALKNLMITVSFNKKNGLPSALEMIARITDGRLAHKNGIFTIE